MLSRVNFISYEYDNYFNKRVKVNIYIQTHLNYFKQNIYYTNLLLKGYNLLLL